MAEFVYFRNACSMYYPVGQYFSSDNFDYIREAASSINKVFPTGKLILVVRGHSGSILAGGIAYILKRKDRDVLISVSRKAESTHGDNLEGIYPSCISDNTHMKFLYRVCKKSELLYLKDFTKVTVCGLGGHYSIANNDTPRYYTDYNYYPYIVRVSDIENYKKEKFPKEKVV